MITGMAACLVSSVLAGQYGFPNLTLTYLPNSSAKQEQIIGDVDWANPSLRTTSQTESRANVLGNGLGYSFPYGNQLIFLFGDTIGGTPPYYPTWTSEDLGWRWQAHDPLASCTAQSSKDPLNLTFWKDGAGRPIYIWPQYPDGQQLDMGANDIPNSGITINNEIYVICNSGCINTNGVADYSQSFSVLSKYSPSTETFEAIGTVSKLPGGHFVIDALHLDGPSVLVYGIGERQNSNIYFARASVDNFVVAHGFQYFSGYQSGQPTWSNFEKNAQPIVTDPASSTSPAVSGISIIYSQTLGLWLMTFSSHSQSGEIWFTYAPTPTGPWAPPQDVYNAKRDGGLGTFIRQYNATTGVGSGPIGPTIGDQTVNNPTTTPGTVFAPQMIEKFSEIEGSNLRIFYTMSTWNPYTVVLMHSDFKIGRAVIKLPK